MEEIANAANNNISKLGDYFRNLDKKGIKLDGNLNKTFKEPSRQSHGQSQ